MLPFIVFQPQVLSLCSIELFPIYHGMTRILLITSPFIFPLIGFDLQPSIGWYFSRDSECYPSSTFWVGTIRLSLSMIPFEVLTHLTNLLVIPAWHERNGFECTSHV